MADQCPPECKVKINGINQNIAELKETDKKQWEVFDQKIHDVEGQVIERVRTKTLIALFGVIVTLFLAIMALTFNTLHSGQKEAALQVRTSNTLVQQQMGSLERQMVKVVTQLEFHTNESERNTGRTN